MKVPNNHLIVIRQLDAKLKSFAALDQVLPPSRGWINQLRKAFNMSLAQMGGRLSKTPQAIKEMENRESDESITLKSLREAGDALNMKLVYGFVPKEESLEKMVEDRARKLAKKIVKRTSTTMQLEDQENSDSRLKQAVEELTQEIKREIPRSLWD
ncbi:mobile mystery protein A [Dyadobacter sp. CY323]|uniref:mobile mystery protein A n=1 Tax=Dyadobacter sp. CY323 TaxID=2907302 RepID=UPI001F1D3E6A|nr:mobile mystery protein A [Dyadobacter sp. CY323]MCE6988989.1 mobile mystery protein A [Dyadobacter sp. CY323]